MGDLRVIYGQWGTVKEIRVRRTIFETFDRCVLIIPNSELVANKVLNWTHYGRGIRPPDLKSGGVVWFGCGGGDPAVADVGRANPRAFESRPPRSI